MVGGEARQRKNPLATNSHLPFISTLSVAALRSGRGITTRSFF